MDVRRGYQWVEVAGMERGIGGHEREECWRIEEADTDVVGTGY